MPQMAGAGVLVRLLTGISYDWAVIFVGVAMIVYVAFGGMLATTWVQIVKAVLMLSAGAIILLMALSLVQFQSGGVVRQCGEQYGARLSLARQLPEKSVRSDFARARLCARPRRPAARDDALLHGAGRQDRAPFGGVGDVPRRHRSSPAPRCSASQPQISSARSHPRRRSRRQPHMPLLAQYLGGGKGTFGGDLMLGFVAAVAVATILAVVSGLTLSTSGAIAHDFYTNWLKHGKVDGGKEVWIARVSAIVIGVLAIALGILAQGVNVAVLVILAICVAASANFPVLILSLFWRRFNTGGVVGGMAVGLSRRWCWR